MSVSKWAYEPDKCDGYPCPGDCDGCSKSAEENQCDNCIHAAVCRFEEPENPCGYFEPKRETGEWIPGNEITVVASCSVCGWAACACESDVSDLPFCPNCGARLEMED